MLEHQPHRPLPDLVGIPPDPLAIWHSSILSRDGAVTEPGGDSVAVSERPYLGGWIRCGRLWACWPELPWDQGRFASERGIGVGQGCGSRPFRQAPVGRVGNHGARCVVNVEGRSWMATAELFGRVIAAIEAVVGSEARVVDDEEDWP